MPIPYIWEFFCAKIFTRHGWLPFDKVDVARESGIICTDGEDMNLLPRHDKAVIPIEKFTEYCLNPKKDIDKATAFSDALGYNEHNAYRLIANIKHNLSNFPAIQKGDLGFGMRHEVIMNLTGPNGKSANVLTGWIDDKINGEMRLTTAHVD